MKPGFEHRRHQIREEAHPHLSYAGTAVGEGREKASSHSVVAGGTFRENADLVHHQVGLTRASILFPIVTYLDRIGAPVDRLLAQSNLPRWILTDPEALIPTAGAPRLLCEAARAQGLEDVGVRAGELARIESLGVFGRTICRSRTLADAVAATIRHHPTFSSNGRMWLVYRGDRIEFCQAFTNRFDDGWQQASHYVAMLMLGIVRLAAGETWRPDEVRFQTTECAALRDLDAFSGARLQFAQPSTAIVFPSGFLVEPVRSPFPLAPQEDLDVWRGTAPVSDFVGSMLQVIETLSGDAYPDIPTTAHLVGMSVRTLQRRLAAGGTTHEELVDRARFTTAAALLDDTDAKILDVALDLGYSDHAHFTRAFRRWAGCSPQKFRRRRRAPVTRDQDTA